MKVSGHVYTMYVLGIWIMPLSNNFTIRFWSCSDRMFFFICFSYLKPMISMHSSH